MARYGSWDDRPREGREGAREERWRREEAAREWRDQDRWRTAGRGEREEFPDYEYRTYGREGSYARPEERGYRDEQRWARYDEPRREYRSELDPPWVERGPSARGREDTRGMVEWEDRGPLKWLGDKVREATGRPSRGPKGYMRSDERIHDDVCERIARSGVDADEVEVKVEKREVTLTGSVRSREEKWRLEEVVDDVFGVEDVHNQLKIARVEGGARTDAGAIEGRHLRH
jgi:hypothetical protein